MGKKVVILFSIPFFLMVIFYFYFFSYVNKKNQERVLMLSMSQAKLTSAFISVAGNHLLESGEKSLESFLSGLLEREDVIYVAVVKEGKPIFWDSVYSGYLPIGRGKSPRLIPSPIGSILEIKSILNKGYEVYIGFDFSLLDEIRKRAFTNFLVVFLFLLFFSSLSLGYMLYVNSLYFRKEKELLKERQEKERFKELSMLAASLSHELKNPINNLYLNLQLLEGKVREENARKYLSVVKDQARRLSSIVETHLSLVRLSPRLRKVNLRDVLSSLISEKIELIMEEEFQMRTDPQLLHIAISNLIRNSEEAGASRIWIRVLRGRIEVEDDAGGVNKEELSKIFSPFYSGKREGTGIGLALVRRIIEALGGRIKGENGDKGLKIIMEFSHENFDN